MRWSKSVSAVGWQSGKRADFGQPSDSFKALQPARQASGLGTRN
jgi:hypothetical protein